MTNLWCCLKYVRWKKEFNAPSAISTSKGVHNFGLPILYVLLFMINKIVVSSSRKHYPMLYGLEFQGITFLKYLDGIKLMEVNGTSCMI